MGTWGDCSACHSLMEEEPRIEKYELCKRFVSIVLREILAMVPRSNQIDELRRCQFYI